MMAHEEFFQQSERFAELRDNVRERYLNTISAAADEALATFILPNDQASMAIDIAQFTAMLMVEKLADILVEDKADRWALKRLWGKINRSMEQEIPLMLNELAEAVASGEFGDGNRE